MRRLLVVLAACSSPAPPPAPIAAPHPPGDAAVMPDAGAAARPAMRPQHLPHGPPSGAMVAVTATEDGSAAVSADGNGNVRVWPVLDGTREPFTLPVAAPTREAIVRAGDAFAIAAIDSAGGLHVLRVTPAGELIERTDIMTEPALRDVVAIDHGFLAVRGDQAIVQIGSNGRMASTLFPARGEQVMGIVYRRGGALALVETAAGLRGQWIENTGRLAWGDTTATFELDPATVVLSPDHRHVAGRAPAHGPVRIYDLDNGTKVVAQGDLTPVGFLDDTRLGFATADIGWWGLDGKVIAQPFSDLFDSGGVAGDHGFVLGANHDLMLVDPDTKALHYLGYETDTVYGIAGSAIGVVIETRTGSLALDDELAARVAIGGRYSTPVDDTQAIGLTDNPKCPDPTSCAATWIATYDANGKLLFRGFDATASVRYEPATRLVSALRAHGTVAALFDPATHKIGAPVATSYPELALLDPALAGGAVALGLRETGKGTAVKRYRALVPDADGDDPVTLPGTVAATDRAGRVYLRQSDGTIVIHDGAHELGRITELLKGWVPRPNRDGTLVAAFANGRLLLATTDGTIKWTAGLPGVQDLAWTLDGKLVALAAGVIQIDLADGSPQLVRCGWRFALRTTPTSVGADTNACDR